MDQHREGQVRTQTIVEGISRDVTSLTLVVSKLSDAMVSSNQAGAGKWEQFFAKGFWLIAGAAVSYLAVKYK